MAKPHKANMVAITTNIHIRCNLTSQANLINTVANTPAKVLTSVEGAVITEEGIAGAEIAILQGITVDMVATRVFFFFFVFFFPLSFYWFHSLLVLVDVFEGLKLLLYGEKTGVQGFGSIICDG